MSATITPTVCACDAVGTTAITNLPGLSQIAFRIGDFNDFRRALLTPLLSPPAPQPEQSLTAWRAAIGADPSIVDLGVMMVEWWAYLADILTFYNERIANEDYLRTAALPETPAALIQLLGYRPRPAIGATGTLAALVTPSIAPGQTVQLPMGLQFQSKPGPGQAPQIFELSAATSIGVPDQVPAVPPPMLLDTLSSGYAVLLAGTVTTVSSGSLLLLGPRDDTRAPTLISLSAAPTPQTTPSGQKQTVLTFSQQPSLTLTAENARLTVPNQSAGLWTVNHPEEVISNSGTVIQLAGVVRQIRTNDYVVITDGSNPQLVQVQQANDLLGDASTNGSPTSVSKVTSGQPPPIPVLHTQLTVNPPLPEGMQWDSPGFLTVLYDWVEVGKLVDQPPGLWDGISTGLQAVPPGQFPTGTSLPILLQDNNGVGAAGSANVSGGSLSSPSTLSVTWPDTTVTPLSPELQAPIEVLFNLLPVTRGQTVANEIVGSGDATVAGQSFTLAKSPVTYLAQGSGYASTIALTVNGQPWTEVASFYGQAANAQVFVTREDAQQNTHIDFGDGVNGARLPTGTNNVIATYRIGGGAALPPAGKLTVIAQSYPGLRSVLNPVIVSGGSDPDPASLLKQYAPRSVLTFGRAVSVFDYQALAAQAPGVTMSSATWSWDTANSRAAITVYVAGEPNVAASVGTLLTVAGDPNRPVTVLPAQPQPVILTMTFTVVQGMDQDAITAALTTALSDPQIGLFSPSYLGIGQALFDSQIEAVCLGVAGVVGIQSSRFSVNGATDAGPLHNPGESGYFSLQSFNPTLQAAQ